MATLLSITLKVQSYALFHLTNHFQIFINFYIFIFLHFYLDQCFLLKREVLVTHFLLTFLNTLFSID